MVKRSGMIYEGQRNRNVFRETRIVHLVADSRGTVQNNRSGRIGLAAAHVAVVVATI